ncbi:hypothetical protein ACH5RR_029955 [Cinchona calisaya]|uniref:Uncharacterized protein n=1 Tax=Cinchona calisaya TaxID=153742 RepID=A0ABD2YT65_9GENT
MGRSCVTLPKQKDKGKGKQLQVHQIVASNSSTKENNPIHEEKEARVPKINPIQVEAFPSPAVVGTSSALFKEVQIQGVISQISALNQNQISNLNEEVEIFVEQFERIEAQVEVQMQEVLLVFNEKNQISNLNEVAQELRMSLIQGMIRL